MKIIHKINRNIGRILMVFIPLWIISFFLLSFVNSKGCQQIAIDSYEVHSGIDIPAVDVFNCYYDKEKDVRMSVYRLNGGSGYYLQSYKDNFRPVNTKDVFFALPLADSEKPVSERLYISAGTTFSNSWRYILERESGRLWVEIKYTPTLGKSILRYVTAIIFVYIPVLFLALFLFNISRKVYFNFKRRVAI